MIITRINPNINRDTLFNLLKIPGLHMPFLLDSGMDFKTQGRFSIFGCNPFKEIYYKIGQKDMDPFEVLDQALQQHRITKAHDTYPEIPFVGGAVGFIGYDMRKIVDVYTEFAHDDLGIEDMIFGLYHGGIVYDHDLDQGYIVDAEIDDQSEERLSYLQALISHTEVMDEKANEENRPSDSSYSSNMTKDEYMQSLQKVKDHIRQGDIYQVNLTQRFMVTTEEKPLDIYERLRSFNPAPFGAYLDYGHFQILSSSPERFLKIDDKKMETRPIKGTRPRTDDPILNEKYKRQLQNSEKDKSELLMIVDLERNDLGKYGKVGSVKVPELFVIEEYPTVYHLVSTVTAQLDDAYTEVQAVKGMFPGGSITGAPKLKAMEVIDSLEPTSRGVYTGSIGYFGFNGHVDLNIVIRTILLKDQKAYFQTGGGIVWDSEAEFEYEETFHKAKALMRALRVDVSFIDRYSSHE